MQEMGNGRLNHQCCQVQITKGTNSTATSPMRFNCQAPSWVNVYSHVPRNLHSLTCFYLQVRNDDWEFYKIKQKNNSNRSFWQIKPENILVEQTYDLCFFAFCLMVTTISRAIFWCSLVCECKSRASTVSQSTLHIRHHPMLGFLFLELSKNCKSP
jgi:hypothetical protein